MHAFNMKHLLFTFSAPSSSWLACGQPQTNVNIPTKDPGKPSPNEQVADFSEGCFWHAEIVFKSLRRRTGMPYPAMPAATTTIPDYEKVCTGTTGHAETVQVYYDPSKISFTTLVAAFFASVDPTELDRQGND